MEFRDTLWWANTKLCFVYKVVCYHAMHQSGKCSIIFHRINSTSNLGLCKRFEIAHAIKNAAMASVGLAYNDFVNKDEVGIITNDYNLPNLIIFNKYINRVFKKWNLFKLSWTFSELTPMIHIMKSQKILLTRCRVCFKFTPQPYLVYTFVKI